MSLFNSAFGRYRSSGLAAFVLASVAVLALVSPAWSSPPPSTRPVAAGPIAVVRLSGEVDDYSRDQLTMRFDRARAAGAKTVILEIDTYGGLVTAGLDISRFVKNQTDLHTIAFVNSKAISAGAMIAMACDEIVMAPSGTLGDCAPIQVAPGVGMVPMQPTERSKQESPILADFAESAKRNGHDPLLAAAMVSIPYTVYWVENSAGQRRFVGADDFKSMTADGEWKPVPGEPSPIDGDKTLLTVHTDQAVTYGLAKGRATSAADLASQRGLSIVASYDNTFGDRLVAFFGGTLSRILLLVIFINALIVAIKTPGTGAAEAIATLSLAMLVGVPLLTGYAEWWEIGLIVVGIGLIVFEIFVFPGHLVSIISGILMVVSGLVLTFVGDAWRLPGSWNSPGTWASLERGIQVTVVGLACSMVVSSILRRFLPRMPYFNKLILPETGGPAAAVIPPFVAPEPAESRLEDRWPFVGTVGVAVSELKPGGSARFPYGADAQVTSVVNQGGYLPAGTKVVVREVHGNHVVVRPLA